MIGGKEIQEKGEDKVYDGNIIVEVEIGDEVSLFLKVLVDVFEPSSLKNNLSFLFQCP